MILPIYNVAPYLERAVDSLLSQTYENFEVFLVDDGSTDGSGRICDAYAERDGRVIALHQKNAGAPTARNAGIKRAAGRYLYFMDGDDWAEPHMLERLVEAAFSTDAQLVIAGFAMDTRKSRGGVFRQILEAGARRYDDRVAFRRDAARLFDQNLLYPPWNKLYSADYIREKNICFPDTFWDDFPFNLAVIRDVERVVLIPAAGYHFMRERKESETARYQAGMYEKREEEHGWMLELYAHWGIADGASREMIARRHAERAVGCIENLTCAASPLTGRARRERVAAMLANPLLQESLALARPRSLMMRCMLLPLKWRRAGLSVLLGRLISFVKAHEGGLFARLKARR